MLDVGPADGRPHVVFLPKLVVQYHKQLVHFTTDNSLVVVNTQLMFTLVSGPHLGLTIHL